MISASPSEENNDFLSFQRIIFYLVSLINLLMNEVLKQFEACSIQYFTIELSRLSTFLIKADNDIVTLIFFLYKQNDRWIIIHLLGLLLT